MTRLHHQGTGVDDSMPAGLFEADRIEDARSQLSTATFHIEAAIPKVPEAEQYSLQAAANIVRAVLGRITVP